MNWTSDKPTEPGLYVWWLLGDEGQHHYGVIQVFEGGKVLSHDSLLVEPTRNHRWLGPLPEDNLE